MFVGGKKKPLKAPKKQAKDVDEVSITIVNTANIVFFARSEDSTRIFCLFVQQDFCSAHRPHEQSAVHKNVPIFLCAK